MKLDATLIAAFGRQYEARTAAGEILLCVPRGKKSVFACGDHVKVAVTGPGQGVIEKLEERRSLLYRSDAWRQKLIAANATQVVLVVATEPSFSDEFLSRCLCAAESQQLKVLIVLNKADLAAGLASSRALLAPFAALGYPILELSALGDVASGALEASENADGTGILLSVAHSPDRVLELAFFDSDGLLLA